MWIPSCTFELLINEVMAKKHILVSTGNMCPVYWFIDPHLAQIPFLIFTPIPPSLPLALQEWSTPLQ